MKNKLLPSLLFFMVQLVVAQVNPPTYDFDSYIYTTGNANVDHLTALLTGDVGASFKVYDAAVGGNEITSGSDLTDDTTVYAVQVVSGNESNTRLAIPVNEICAAAQDLPSGSRVLNLVATPANGQTASWYTSATGDTALDDSVLLSNQTYYVEQGVAESTVAVGPELGFPNGVAVDALGNILVAETFVNAPIKRMDASGNNVVTLGSGFSFPADITVDASGHILVADNGNNAVKRMDASGNNIITLGSGFNEPRGIAVDASGNIYVADTGNNVIKRMDANGNNITTLGTGFDGPQDVAVDALGYIYVADTGNNAIKRMDANGNNMVTLGSGFNFPFGVVVDVSGDIIVADTDNNIIKRMDANGNNITSLGPGFGFPTKLTVEASGNILVADFLNNTPIKRINIAKRSNRVAVQVSVPIDPPSYAFDSYIYTTGNANVDNLTALLTGDAGASFKVYDAAMGGNEITSGTDLTDDTICYAIQVVDAVESTTRLAIPVNEICTATQNFVSGSRVVDLAATPSVGETASWYTTATGGTALSGAETLNNQSYYVEQGQSESTVTLGSGFNQPFGVTVDASGNIIVADASNNAIKRMDASGNNIVTLGSGFSFPAGIVVDALGNILVADAENNAIKRMDASGNNIVTLGSGFSLPHGVAVDASGNVYVADTFNNAIKRMDADGNNIVTLGSGFNLPYGIAIDPSGNILVADASNNAIKRMDANGNNIMTLGSGFFGPYGVALDAEGNILVADTFNNAIKRMDTNGNNIVTLGSGINQPFGLGVDLEGNVLVGDAGNNAVKRINLATSSNRVAVEVSLPPGPPSYAFDNYIYTNGNANVDHLSVLLTGDTGASFKIYDAPTGGNEITSGNDLMDDTTVYAVQVVNGEESNTRLAIPVNEICEALQNVAVGTTVADLTTSPTVGQTASWYAIATGGTALPSTDVLGNQTYYVAQGQAESTVTVGSGFSQPFAVTVDAAGNIFVADAGDNTIKRMDANGNNMVTLGSGFSFPNGVAVDASGNIYVADTNNSAIKRMDANGNNIVTLGTGFSFPSGVAVDASGNIYVADTSNNAIKRMDANGNNIVTLGTGFNLPYGVALDAVGNILVADFLNNAIKRMDANGNNIVTLGTGFNFPYAVAVDAVGNILVADAGNNAIKRMDASGNNIVTLGAGFNQPFGVTVDTAGNILVADFGNNAIKRINEAIVSNRVDVQVSVLVDSPVYEFDSYIYITGNESVDHLTALLTGDAGASFKIYDAPTGGNEIPSGTDLTDDNTVYAVQVISGNESTTRLAIPVNEIGTATQNLSGGATVADLDATPTNGQTASWYSSAIGGTALASTETLSNQTYYVEQGQTESTVTVATGFNVPNGVAADAAGNILVSDTFNNAIKRIDANGNIVTLGSGFSSPRGITVDTSNNILVADSDNNAIKRMDVNGNNIVILGSGFNQPRGVAVDASGNIYVADTDNDAIKRMDTSGNNIVTLGSGFSNPTDVALDSSGNIIVVDASNNVIKRMDTSGNNIVILGSGFSAPRGITVDASDNIIVANRNSNTIRRMDASGNNIVTLGSGFNRPRGVGIDVLGNILVADSNNNAIKRINLTTSSNRVEVQVSIQVDPPTYPFGSYIYTSGNANVDDLTALLTGNTGASFKIYDAPTGGNEITSGSDLTDDTTVYAVQVVGGIESSTRRTIPVNEIGEAIQNVAGVARVEDLITTPTDGQTASWYTNATGGTTLADTDLLTSETYYVAQEQQESTVTLGSGFNFPFGATVDAAGHILVADRGNNVIKRMDASGNNIVSLGAGFNTPSSVALDAFGNIYVADTNNNAIKRMDADGNNIVTLGSGFNRPRSVAVDALGNIYVADTNNNAIKRMDANGNNVITLGSGFDSPNGIALDALGNIYVADTDNSAVKRMDADGNNIVILGAGFNEPSDVAVDTSGNILVADTDNNAIKRMDSSGNNIVTLGSGIDRPVDVAVDALGNILVVELLNSPIKRINLVTSSNRVAVQVSVEVIAQPVFPFDSYIYTTGNANVDHLIALVTGDAGASFKIYDAPTDGNEITSGTDLTDDTTVYAVQVIGGSESNTRLAIEVNEICEATQNVSNGATVADLVATPTNGNTARWYTSATGGNPLADTDVLSDQIYYIEQGQASNTVTLGSGFNQPHGVTVDASGNILVADRNNATIKRMDVNGNNIVTLASGIASVFDVTLDPVTGNIIVSHPPNFIKLMDASGNNIANLGSGFNQPRGVAVDASGNIYVADRFNSAIKRMDASGNNMVTLGSGFAGPRGVAVDAMGNIYVADTNNSVIKRMDADGNNIVTLGSGFAQPESVVVDAAGNIYVADTTNDAIKRMDADGNNITILASGLNRPVGIEVDAMGNVIFSDTGNNSIMRINRATSSNRIPVQVNRYTAIPDLNFEIILELLDYDDISEDGQVPTALIEGVTNLNLSNDGINDLIGIQDFTALEVLNINLNNMSTIDLSNNIALTSLFAVSNNLASIDLTNNTLLEDLRLGSNHLSTIDVSLLTSLRILQLGDNNLTEVDVSNNPLLESYRVNGNDMTSVDLSNNPLLQEVRVEANELVSFNMQNGANALINDFSASGNASLNCILVDDVAFAEANFTNIDNQTSFSDTSCGLNFSLDLKVYLQGAALNPNAGEESLMRDDLRVGGLIPTTSPYTDALSCDASVFNTTGTDAIVDWVWIELRDATDNTIVSYSRSALLQRDGHVVDVDGTSALDFLTTNDAYHVVINHRGHLGIMTNSTITFSQGATEVINFTHASNPITYGDHAQTTFGMPSGVLGLWAGNVSSDNTVKYQGGSNDTTSIKDEVLNDLDNSTSSNLYTFAAYNNGDVDMDGVVQYQGSGNDSNVVKDTVLSHPDNQSSPSNLFIITEQLPELIMVRQLNKAFNLSLIKN
ncbi:MAG: hypothetical protein AAFX55_04045 [Bacteroidota bacterium]